MTILNLTMHPATAEQLETGCVDLPEKELAELRNLLNFVSLPDKKEIESVSAHIALLAAEYTDSILNIPEGSQERCAMIGGAPFLMHSLHHYLELYGFRVCYAFSVRESVEKTAEDGSVIKTNVFKHKGYVFP